MSTPQISEVDPNHWEFQFPDGTTLTTFGGLTSLAQGSYVLVRDGEKWPSIEGNNWRAIASTTIKIIPCRHSGMLHLEGSRCSLHVPDQHLVAVSSCCLDYYFSGGLTGQTTVHSQDKRIGLQIRGKEYSPDKKYSHMTYDYPTTTDVYIDFVRLVSTS